jgi:outer membrane usher protein
MSVLDAPGFAPIADAAVETNSHDLYLDIIVNNERMRRFVAVRQEAGGGFSINPDDLRASGILPDRAAQRKDGRIDLARLPEVTVEYDAPSQALLFHASDKARVARRVSPRTGLDPLDPADPRNKVQTGAGALMNYALYANGAYGPDDPEFDFGGVSGTFQARMFSPIGIAENSFSLSGGQLRRLDTFLARSDPVTMTTYRGGDLITGGLSWTRPVRLGGFQMQRNFGLRPGLVTLPIPGFTGSAAVPSTVEVFLNNSRRFSQSVGAGPFEVVDLPVVTGPGRARVVVHDENGNEVVTESEYFVSDRLLRPKLLDYSLDIGFPRNGFGTEEDRYDDRLFASASLRYGLTDWLTLEGHAEGGEGLINGGVGVVSTLGNRILGSLSVAGSKAHGEEGVQVSGALEFDLGRMHLQARIQRAFGEYSDIASVSRRDNGGAPSAYAELFGGNVHSLGQVSASMPVLDFGSLNFSYTQLETIAGNRDRLISADYSRPLLGGTLSASGYINVENDDFGVVASLSFPIGGGVTAGTGVRSDEDGVGVYATASRAANDSNGNVSWQAQYQKRDDQSRFAGRAEVKTALAKVGGTLSHSERSTFASAHVSGAVVAAGGDLFLSNRIDDAFAIIDAGAPDVEVLRENRPVGKTGYNGKLIVPDLRSFERNRLGIDPTGLPLDAVVTSTRKAVIPADHAGIYVAFSDNADGGNALVSLHLESGDYVPAGSSVIQKAGSAPAVVGYDGQVFLSGLQKRNRIVVQLPSGERCAAHFNYVPERGSLVTVDDVPCVPE